MNTVYCNIASISCSDFVKNKVKREIVLWTYQLISRKNLKSVSELDGASTCRTLCCELTSVSLSDRHWYASKGKLILPVALAYQAETFKYVAGKPAVDIGRHIHYSALDSRWFGCFDHLIQQKFREKIMTYMIDQINNGRSSHH